jgi:outer membrane protein
MLKYQLGLSMNSEVILTEDIDGLIDANLITLDNLYTFNLEDNIDFRLLSTQEKLNQLSLRREKSLYLPSLSAFYQYNDRLERADFDFTMRHMVGVSMSIPIFNSGMKNAKVSQAGSSLKNRNCKKIRKHKHFFMVADQARFDYLNAMETYQNEIDNFELSTRILETPLPNTRREWFQVWILHSQTINSSKRS